MIRGRPDALDALSFAVACGAFMGAVWALLKLPEALRGVIGFLVNGY